MEILETIEAARRWTASRRAVGRTIGFVPTMGYLHDGHLSLVRLARQQADVVVVSIFVNPTQFGPNEDLARYPRDFARDEALCRAEGVDAIFYPSPAMMYPPGYSTYVVEEALGNGLCGASRPGHFRGVTTVVAKLFNILQPDCGVFGEKDAQQLRIIRRMVRDLDIPVALIAGPIAREADGLAMSSRNALLSPENRAEAVWLSRALTAVQDAVTSGMLDRAGLIEIAQRILTNAPRGKIDYVTVVDDETLVPVERVERPALMALAVFFGPTRLIDNVRLLPPDHQSATSSTSST